MVNYEASFKKSLESIFGAGFTAKRSAFYPVDLSPYLARAGWCLPMRAFCVGGAKGS